MALMAVSPTLATADSEPEPREDPGPPAAGEVSHWISRFPLHIHREADEDDRGLTHANEAFEVLGPAEGRHCKGPGWGKTRGDGFVCLENAVPTDKIPRMLPNYVDFPHPDSRENEDYLETGEYNLTPDMPYPNAPFIYARRYKEKKGRVYKSAEAYARGESSIYRIGGTKTFIRVEDTERGKVLVRRNGHVVPLDDVRVVTLSRLQSYHLRTNPVPDGMLPAWAIRGKGTRVRAKPHEDAKVIQTLDYHTPLLIRDQPVKPGSRWWEVPDGGGEGVPGYVQDRSGIRHWVPAPPPKGVGDDEFWIDVDLGQQVLGLRRGAELEYLTMVSTGVGAHPTPRGLYQIKDKTVYANMASAPGAEKPYFVGNVPWIIHFWPRYAIHGAFWHWGFGWRRSHGCINMTLHDVRTVYEDIQPTNYPGWKMVFANENYPGTMLRIRRGDQQVIDRRKWR